MKISYAITVCNELEEIKRLLDFLISNKREQDEIVVLFDDSDSTKQMETLLHSYRNAKQIILHIDYFGGHFANWKNQLMDICSGDYIFQIDVDEIPNSNLIENLPTILENNVDVILVPRINTVQGITQQHIQHWGWKQNDKGWIQWPDFQWRIYKNDPEIKWKNKLHEVLDGFKTYSNLPEMEEYALYHPKTIEKQEQQNSFYSKL